MKSFMEYLLELKAIQGTQYGSNSGGVHEDEHGQRFYVKKYKNPEQAKAEVLAGKIYKHMGIKTVDPEMHGEDRVKSKWNDHLSTKHPRFYDKPSRKHAEQLSKMYHAAVLTKNWDIIGTEHDNVMHNSKTDDLHSIDHGGAFHFRAMGGHKDYDHDIHEKESLMDRHLASGHVFSSAFKHHPEALAVGKEAVRKIDDDHIHHLFKTSGLKDWEKHHAAFVSKKKALLK